MADKTLMIDTGRLIDYFRKTDKSNARLTEFEIYSGATSPQLTF